MLTSLASKLTFASLFFVLGALACAAQSPTAEKPTITADEKAEKIVQKAVQTMGGDRYLNVKTIIARGFFTDYHDGVSGIPLRFVDYIVYPNKERTEFSGGGQRLIQTNDRDKGWVYDGAALTLKDQTVEQLEEFRLSTRTGIENLLRGGWRTQGAKLSYVGRREAGLARRNETVRLTYPDGFWIEYEFAAADGLPAKILYQRKVKKPDSDELEEVPEEDRMYKPITLDGIVANYVIDHFRNGLQTSRTNYETVEFNKPIADALFAKPANFKAVK
ncbi:MAG: hypothetical protein QOH41_3717 [Blastocatellia bacterium]|jgi:hypothetical protein|nr:hypothetical protein [Blastocatellia bacterium]